MTRFSNSFGAGEGTSDYVAAVLALVGERDPLEVLRSTPDVIGTVLAGRDAASLRRGPAPGKWSAAAVVQHLADAEVAWGWRIRQVLAVERPTLEGYDQDAWARAFGYDEVDAEPALRLFTALREGNLRLLERLGPAELLRVALHAERGEETVAHMIRLNAGHDLVHLAQLERVLAAT